MQKRREHVARVRSILTREYLVERYVGLGHSASAIAADHGFSTHTVNNRLKKYRIVRESAKPRRERWGETNGKVKVIEVDAVRRGGSIYWTVECECGTVKQVADCNIKNTSSCGCTRYRSGQESYAWKGCGELSGRYWSIVRSNAESRGLEFDLDVQYGWELFLSQNRKCALTGWDLTMRVDTPNSQTASLDRKDSTKGYIAGNVQWVHKIANVVKWTLTEKQFFAICTAVVRHNGLENADFSAESMVVPYRRRPRADEEI